MSWAAELPLLPLFQQQVVLERDLYIRWKVFWLCSLVDRRVRLGVDHWGIMSGISKVRGLHLKSLRHEGSHSDVDALRFGRDHHTIDGTKPRSTTRSRSRRHDSELPSDEGYS